MINKGEPRLSRQFNKNRVERTSLILFNKDCLMKHHNIFILDLRFTYFTDK